MTEPCDEAVDAAVKALLDERNLNLAQAINTALTVLRSSLPSIRGQIGDEIAKDRELNRAALDAERPVWASHQLQWVEAGNKRAENVARGSDD